MNSEAANSLREIIAFCYEDIKALKTRKDLSPKSIKTRKYGIALDTIRKLEIAISDLEDQKL